MIHLIYLAAGYGERFGSNKLLYLINGKPMYLHVLERLAAAVHNEPSCYDLLVVTQYSSICRRALEMSLPFAVNPDPSRGISSSLQTGILKLTEKGQIRKGDCLVFFQADQPFLSDGLIDRFLHELKERSPLCAAVSVNKDPVSPCAFREELIPDLMALTGDTGGKRIIREYIGNCFLFEAEDAEQLADIDQL